MADFKFPTQPQPTALATPAAPVAGINLDDPSLVDYSAGEKWMPYVANRYLVSARLEFAKTYVFAGYKARCKILGVESPDAVAQTPDGPIKSAQVGEERVIGFKLNATEEFIAKANASALRRFVAACLGTTDAELGQNATAAAQRLIDEDRECQLLITATVRKTRNGKTITEWSFAAA